MVAARSAMVRFLSLAFHVRTASMRRPLGNRDPRQGSQDCLTAQKRGVVIVV